MLLAALTNSQSFVYTAQRDCKMVVNSAYSSSSGATINGVYFALAPDASGQGNTTHVFYLGTGDTVRIGTGSTDWCIVSAYWG